MEFQINNDGVHQSLGIAIAELDDFSYRILNDLPGTFIKCVYQLEQSDQSAQCQYGLGGKRSLQRYVGQLVSLPEMFKIISQIAEQLLLLCDYLVDIRQVYLSDQTIFIDLLTNDIRLLLVPVKQYGDFPTFKQWLIGHIEAHRRLYSTAEGQQLIDYVRSDEFCLSGLIGFIKELQNSRQQKSQNFQENFQKTVKKNAKHVAIDHRESSNSLLPYLALLLLQLLFIVGYVIIYLMAPNLTADLLAARLGSLLIILSVDVIATRALIRYLEIDLTALKNWRSFKQLAVKQSEPISTSAETTILAMAGNKAQLLDLVDDQCYLLNAATTLIGRQDSADIYLASRTVGRRHCQISRSADGFQIEDLASVNGTFLNDQRLPSGSVWPLKNGDKLRVADWELIFIND